MDLGTISAKLDRGAYEPVAGMKIAPGFVHDVELVFKNAMQYNHQGSEYHEHAREMLAWVATKTAALENDGTRATSKPDKKPPKSFLVGKSETVTAVCASSVARALA